MEWLKKQFASDKIINYNIGKKIVITDKEMEFALKVVAKKKKASSVDNVLDCMFHFRNFKRMKYNSLHWWEYQA